MCLESSRTNSCSNETDQHIDWSGALELTDNAKVTTQSYTGSSDPSCACLQQMRPFVCSSTRAGKTAHSHTNCCAGWGLRASVSLRAFRCLSGQGL
jgi:hypothetical protein